jgi:galactose mutarotase-like enzyme
MMDIIEYQGREIRRWERGPSAFLVTPEAGARLMNWNVTLGDGSIRDVIHWPETLESDDFAKVRGGNPILFPFAGTSYADGQRDHWQTPDGDVLPMPQHGFARQGVFRIASIDEYGFAAELVPNDESRACYPYDYELLIVYRFAELHVQVSLVLENNDSRPIPWSPGYHFYFHLPWRRDLARKDFILKIPAKSSYAYEANGNLRKLPRPAGEERFSDPSLVNRIFTNLKSPEAVFGTANGEENVSVRIESGDGAGDARSFVTWTENDDSPFYCVEPWMGPPNSTSRKQGPRFVGPGQRDEFTVEVNLI